MADDYRRRWSTYKSAGPANWRRPYHGLADASVVALFSLAEAKGLRVGLAAKDERLGNLTVSTRGGTVFATADASALGVADAADLVRERISAR